MSRSALSFVAAVFATVSSLVTSTALAQTKKNVIVIVADDAGYADFGFSNGISGSTSAIPTPSLDALASRGVRFSRAYAAQSCQPTRAALVTGGYQNRIGNEVVGNNYYRADQGFASRGYNEGVPEATTTIWERMKSQGYTTGAVGKWHLGQTEDTQTQLGNRPQNQGVDEFYGIWHGSRSYIGGLNNNGSDRYQTQALRRAIVDANGNKTDTIIENDHSGEYITNTFGDFAVDFIDNHANQADPFFLYQSFTAPHTPLQNSPDFNDPSLAGLTGDQKVYASMMLTMDKEIGRMMARLEDPNGDGDTSDSITDDTMIVFINDNGGADANSSSPNASDNGVLRRGKGSPFEGGIRVPMIIAGAGIDPGMEGSTFDAPVHAIDILPTAFAAAGGTLAADEAGIDGVNLLPYINGTSTEDPHEFLVHRHRTQFAVVKGDWKLVWSGGTPAVNPQLYNLATDIGETTNVANQAANADLVAELKRDLTSKEVLFDKARYEILGRTDEETINIFDDFTFRPTGPGTQNWSAAGAWTESGTSTTETMFHSDSFAGAGVEFGTSDTFSYVSNNDLTRSTGLEFMLNRIVLSGDFNGTQDQSATIQGRDLLLTNSLDGTGPEIVIDATQNGNNFDYDISLNLKMYDDLTITGNGNVNVTISGQIEDYFDPRNLTKSGTSSVTLTGTNTYAGKTTIQAGNLALSLSGSLDNTSQIEVHDSATFDVSSINGNEFALMSGQGLNGSGTVVGNVQAEAGSTIAAGTDIGELSITGNLEMLAGSMLEIELAGNGVAGIDYDQLDVGGNLILDGELLVMLDSGFNPMAGDAFDILDFSMLTGTFNMVSLPSLVGGLQWDTSDLYNSGEIRIISAVPEPGTLGLLGLGSIGLLLIRRRGI